MEAKREKIVAALHPEWPVPEIMTKLKTSRRTISRVKKSLEDLGHVQQKPGSGRRPTVVSTKLVANIKKSRIKRNPIRSVRTMAKELKQFRVHCQKSHQGQSDVGPD
jgi:hypothetical protein